MKLKRRPPLETIIIHLRAAVSARDEFKNIFIETAIKALEELIKTGFQPEQKTDLEKIDEADREAIEDKRR